jgi:Kef-type K+ transport system membrane component KefB
MSEAGRMILDLLVLFVAARIAGAICERLRQPAVVGELLVGIAIGPHLLGLVRESGFQDLFAQLGVVFLLFVVGLETDPRGLLRVGRHAAAVAVAGVVLPFGLGFSLSRLLGHTNNESLFVGAALAATSVGITARVMGDLGQLQTVVARVVLGAAVFDDILGLLVLAIVSGAASGTLSAARIGLLVGESVAFCVLAVVLGRPALHRISPRVARQAPDASRDPLFALAVALCFAFSALADRIGLAGIVGAFLAGILFAEIPEAPALRRSMRPIYELLVPIFFVLMGVKVNLPSLLSWEVLPLGLLITLAAIVGKVIGCGLSALPLGRRAALAIGLGMMPRGEVGLVVALVGLSRHVIGSQLYSMVVLMCLLTSLIAPPLLRLVLAGPPVPERQGPGEEGRP